MERWLTGVWSAPVGTRGAARTALALPAAAYALGAGLVRSAYDRGWRRVARPALPTISVGNLTVGGTGKTPVAAWLAAQCIARGFRPAIVLRGYGDDEPLVHARLVPEAVVRTGADRATAIAAAAAAGANVAILDDGFQHRRVARDVDLVLLSVEQVAREVGPDGRWHARLLPQGPYREPPAALRRADVLVLTSKGAAAADVARARAAVAEAAPDRPVVHAVLEPAGLVPVAGAGEAMPSSLAGRSILAVAGIGAPALFAAQLAALGASVSLRAFPDHHPYDAGDVAALVRAGRAHDAVVCTLKDAVKLGPRWPVDGPSLSYLSQRCRIVEGDALLAGLLAAVLPSGPGTVPLP